MQVGAKVSRSRFTVFVHQKPKQFCETSSFFEVDNIKNEAILRGFLQKWKVECRADGLAPMRFAIFPFHLSKVLCLPRISEARSQEVLHLSRKIILGNLKIWCSKMQPLSGNQCPDLLTSRINMSVVLRLPREDILRDPLQMSLACHRFRTCHKTLTFCSLLTRCIIPYTTLHYTTRHDTTLHSTPLNNNNTSNNNNNYTYNYNYTYTTTLHYTRLHYTTLQHTTLQHTTLHYITLHYTTLH